jgi:preprotein translocase subunit SecF
MLTLFKPGSNYDFVGKSPTWLRISLVTFIIGVIVLIVVGPNFGLDFTGGHEITVEFANKDVTPEQVRTKMDAISLGETSVQRIDQDPTKSHYIVRVQRTSTFSVEEIKGIEDAFRGKYNEYFSRLRYNPDAGDVLEVELTETASIAAIDTSSAALSQIISGTKHDVRQIRQVGRPDKPTFTIVLKGVDDTVMRAMKEVDPSARPVRVEFVGPTVGAQLRNDGILAVAAALAMILLYIALRFDFYYSPGAIICLFHDTVITVALMAALGEDFTLTTIAALLTLVGYSVNDTIIVFDRIRETVGNAQGKALREVVNRAQNETLARTMLTSSTVLMACVCLMVFGRGTVLFQFGMIMMAGVIFGTYSSIYVASPIFIYLREKYGHKIGEEKPQRGVKSAQV